MGTARPAVAACIAAFLVAASPAAARTDLAAELKAANAALQAGDYETAYREYSRAAEEKKNPLAQFTLALFHQLGWGRPVDPVTACQWFERAAAGNIPVALYSAATCLENGIHRPADSAQAAVWYEKAAGMGHVLSLCHLASLYMTGKGVTKDPQKGVDLCRGAAEKNSPPAQTMLGTFLLEGDDSIRDYGAALSWFERAARSNEPAAQYHLGVMNRDGLGTAKDDAAARTWFESAAAQGYVRAYLPTAKAYVDAFAGAAPGDARDAALAKAYMWLSATVKRTGDAAEIAAAKGMLDTVQGAMPPEWAPELDEKVARHLAEHAARH